MPLYWFLTLLKIAMIALVPVSGERIRQDPSIILDSLILWPRPSSDFILGVAWTLSHELLFYGLFASGLWLGRRWFLAVLVGWASVITGSLLFIDSTHIQQLPFEIQFLLRERNLEFIIGSVLAYALQWWSHHLIRPRIGWFLLSMGIVGWIIGGILVWSKGETGSYLVRFGLPSFAIIGGAVILDSVYRVSWNAQILRGLMVLGNASYAVFLSHFLWFDVIVTIGRPLGLLTLPISIIGGILLIGAVVGGVWLHFLIEKPLAKWITPKRSIQVSQ